MKAEQADQHLEHLVDVALKGEPRELLALSVADLDTVLAARGQMALLLMCLDMKLNVRG